MNDDLPLFVPHLGCERCGGPILAESHTRTDFIEETFDYVSRTVHYCYACGHEQMLDGCEPYYAV